MPREHAIAGQLYMIPNYAADDCYYVDATNGNDANTGLSPSVPLQTIAAVNALTPSPDGSVLFKRGETWSGTITIPSAGIAESLITLGAYGSGAQPILNGGASAAIQVTAASRGYWRIQNLDIRCTGDVEDGARGIHHRAGAGWDEDVPGWIIEDCTFNCGVKIRGANSVIRDNTFDGSGNAQAKHTVSIEETLSTSALIEGNTVSNCLGRGIWLLGIGSNPIVRDNTVHDVTVLGGAEGYGIDIDGYPAAISGVLVEGNRVYTTDGAGIELENCIVSPIVQDNIVSGCGTDGIEVIAYDAHDTVPDYRGVATNGEIYNNLIYECVRGVAIYRTASWEFYHNTIADCSGAGVLIWYDSGVQSQVANLTWQNNIARDCPEVIASRYDVDILNTHDYNCYDAGAFTVDTPFATRNFSEFQAATSQEANSMASDPLFVNATNDNYHIQVTSPVIGAGTDVGIATDLDGVTRGSPPDIGAYEYVA